MLLDKAWHHRPPIQIYVDSDDQLIRKEGSDERVLARNINRAEFGRNGAGNIVMKLRSFRGKKGKPNYKEFVRKITLTPRNGFDR